jgi:hypothetical protein
VTKRRQAAGESFADVVAALPAVRSDEVEEITSPAATGEWVGPNGVAWHRRGEALGAARLRALLRDPEVRVIHVAGADAVELDDAGMDSLWLRLRPYLQGRPRRQGDHTDFVAGEFRDSGTGRLLIVEEDC